MLSKGSWFNFLTLTKPPMAVWLYHNPRMLLLLVLAIIASGQWAWISLPRAEDPATKVRWAWVLVRYPGASAERVEALVTEKVERQLRKLEDVQSIESHSRVGIAAILIKLKDQVTDVERAWSRARDELEDVAQDLPPGVSRPEFNDDEWHSNTMLVALTWNLASPPNQALLRRWAEECRNSLSFAPGTMHARVYGAREEEIRVEVDPPRLAAIGSTAEQIAGRIEQYDAKDSAGAARSSNSALGFRAGAELDSLQRVRQVPVVTHPDGGTLYVGDLASISKTISRPAAEEAFVDGKAAVVIALRMSPDDHIDRWARQITKRLANLRGRLPGGMDLSVLFDQRRYVQERLDQLLENLALGALLVAVTVLVMMGWRAMLAVGLGLPLSVLGVLIGMRCLSIPVHQMSLVGMIMALGLLVDNPIILVDGVRARLRRGDAPSAAISRAARRLFWPLVGSTATTILAFLPLLLLPGAVGEFLGALASTVVLALVSSLLLTFTVVPAVAAHAESRFRGVSAPRWWSDGLVSPRLSRCFRKCVAACLSRPLPASLGMVLVAAAGWLLLPHLDEQFFPQADRDHFQVQLWLAPNASLEATREAALTAHQNLIAHRAVARTHWFVGTSAPKVYHNLLMGKEGTPYFAQGFVQLRTGHEPIQVIRELQTALDRSLQHVQVRVLPIEQGPPFDAPVELRLLGPDLDELDRLGHHVRRMLTADPRVVQATTTLWHGWPEAQFVFDDAALQRIGLDSDHVARQFRTALDGIAGGSILEETEELPVRVRVSDLYRGNWSDVQSMELPVGTGRVPVSALGELRLLPRWASITRRNGERCNAVQAFVRAGVVPATVEAGLRRAVAEQRLSLPPGYRVEFGGASAERAVAVENLGAHVGLLLTLAAILLIGILGSARMAALVAIVALLAVPLALVALWVAGLPLGLVAIIGLVGMVGVAINDTMVVLAALRDDASARMGHRTAIRRVVTGETRHVLTTSITTAAGFLPLIVAGGQLWSPLAIAISAGVAGATLLSLFLVPTLFTILFRRTDS